MSENKKQPTLAEFGFTKKVEEIAVNLPLEAIKVLHQCDQCEKEKKQLSISNCMICSLRSFCLLDRKVTLLDLRWV